VSFSNSFPHFKICDRQMKKQLREKVSHIMWKL